MQNDFGAYNHERDRGERESPGPDDDYNEFDPFSDEYDYGDNKIKIRLDPWQRSVVVRVVSRCRDQFGFLLYHRMGAGKTITMLMIMHNLPSDIPRVIFAPRSILVDSYGPYGDIKHVYSARGDGFYTASKFRLHPIDGDPIEYEGETYPSFTTLLATGRLEETCRGAFVGIDEIHNLVPFLRTGVALETTRRAMLGAVRVVGMTGTPIVRYVSDLTIIMSILMPDAPRGVIPVTDSTFKNKYYVQSPEDQARGQWDTTRLVFKTTPTAIIGGKLGDFAFVNPFLSLVSMAGSLIQAPTVATAAAVAGAAPAVLISAAASAFVYAHFTKWTNSIIQGTIDTIRQTEYHSIDSRRLVEQFESRISFFDYNLFDEAKGKFPISINVEVSAAYTPFQTLMLIRMLDKSNIFTSEDADMLGMDEGEDVSDIQRVFLKYVSRVGDISPDNTNFKTRWLSEHRHVDTVNDVCYAVPMDTAMRVPTGVFGCPKYNNALTILDRYYTMNLPHLVNPPEAFGSFTTNYIWGPESDDKKYYNINGLMSIDNERQCPNVWIDENGRQNLRASPMDENGYIKGRRYLPIVYCSYENTLYEFSAFLTSLGLKHYVFRGDDSQDRRNRLKQLVVEQTYELAKGPYCALLHPSIMEGLSLTYNPCMVILDSIRGYGVQEQVYGRVLRNMTLRKTNERGEIVDWRPENDGKRIRKYIYQMRSGFEPDVSWWKRWTSKENAAKTMDKKDMIESSTIRPGMKRGKTVTRSKLSDVLAEHSGKRYQSYFRPSGSDSSDKQWQMKYWWLPAYTTNWVFEKWWAPMVATKTPDFESCRWRLMLSSPEQMIVAENGQQARILDELASAFKEKTDEKLSEQCGAPKCTPCVTPDDDDCDCPNTEISTMARASRAVERDAETPPPDWLEDSNEWGSVPGMDKLLQAYDDEYIPEGYGDMNNDSSSFS